MATTRARRPRCYLLYATAPEGTRLGVANDAINALTGDESTPLAIFHDHFLDVPGGIVIFHVESGVEVDALDSGIARHLKGWCVETRPLIFSRNPAALDEQIAYTLARYRNADWNALKEEKRPSYSDPSREARTGIED